jgi:hypothetical protein
MTTTVTATTARVFIGKCVVCSRRFRVEGVEAQRATWCDCRKGIECTDWSHGHGSVSYPELDHPDTFIKWQPVKVKLTTRRCDARCEDANSAYCACSCGGRNHGIKPDR